MFKLLTHVCLTRPAGRTWNHRNVYIIASAATLGQMDCPILHITGESHLFSCYDVGESVSHARVDVFLCRSLSHDESCSISSSKGTGTQYFSTCAHAVTATFLRHFCNLVPLANAVDDAFEFVRNENNR